MATSTLSICTIHYNLKVCHYFWAPLCPLHQPGKQVRQTAAFKMELEVSLGILYLPAQNCTSYDLVISPIDGPMAKCVLYPLISEAMFPAVRLNGPWNMKHIVTSCHDKWGLLFMQVAMCYHNDLGLLESIFATSISSLQPTVWLPQSPFQLKSKT